MRVQLWVDDFLQNATDLKITINESDGKTLFTRKHISCLTGNRE